MPELPEVETTKRGIEPYLINQKIQQAVVRNHSLRWPIDENFPDLVKDKQVKTIERRGKYLIFTLNSSSIILHLGMSGRLAITDNSVAPKKHDHIDFILSNNKILRYHDPRRFGACIWTNKPILEHKLLKNLGIEPFDNNLTAKTLYDLSRKKIRSIKSFIMDSKNIVGVGNIYASESLFYAGINPTKACGEISLQKYKQLAQEISKVLLRAIEQGGTTLRDFLGSDGSLGYFSQSLAVYAQAGKDCIKCNAKISHIKMNQRSTYFCPECQK